MAAPTIQEINDTLISQLETQLNQTIPLLPRAFLRVLAKALAGLFIILYKYAGFINLQLFVASASFEATEINGKMVQPLLQWGRLVRVTDPTPAEQAELEISIGVTAQGGTLPSGTQLVSQDNGVTYLTLGPVLLNADTVSATVRASSDQQNNSGAGAIGNLDNGASIFFANPLASVAREAFVTSTTTLGADAESAEAYRQRVIDRFQRVPQGGAYADYALWGSEAPNIANIYPYTSTTPGIVEVYVESSTEADGIPTQAQLDEVEAEIYQPDRRPANAFVVVRAITRATFDVEVEGLSTPNPGSVQVSVQAALAEYLLDREPYIEGLTPAPRRDRVSVAALTAEIEDIVAADGGTFNSCSVTKDAATVIVYTLQQGEKAKLGAVNYV